MGITHGFRVYSPTGAEWTSSSIDTANIGLDSMFEMIELYPINSDGEDVDTLTIGLISIFKPAIAPGYDDSVWSITIGPIDETWDGHQICIDSCYFDPGGDWAWWIDGTESIISEWQGEQCWEIVAETEIEYSGYLKYPDPLPPDSSEKILSNIIIHMIDKDDYSSDDTLATDTTDENGYFKLGPVDNTDDVYQTQDPYFLILADNKAARVSKSYNGRTCSLQTNYIQDDDGGVHDTVFTIPLSESGEYFIAMRAAQGQQAWYNATGEVVPKIPFVSQPVELSYYEPDSNFICITNDEVPQWYLPDTFDESTILHEYGHHVAFTGMFADESQDSITHNFCSITNDSVAFREGFAHFFSSYVLDSSIYYIYHSDFTEWYAVDFESGFCEDNGTTYYTFNEQGGECEGAVAGILWDIYDDNSDDQSTFPPRDTITFLADTSDNIGDNLSVGADIIFDVLLNRTVNGHRPDRIQEFLAAWKQDPSYGNSQELRDIWNEHGILTCGDANGDGKINMGDVMFLIDYIFKGGSAPTPLDAGDVNGQSGVNLGDATYLINYLYGGGPSPNCP